MRMILGLDTPSSGSVLVNGKPYRELTDPLRSVGALLDAKAIVGGRSAASHLAWLADSNGIARRRVTEVLDLVGLSDVAGKRVGTFSLGMNQRLGIAAALLGDPETVMFDEPINGLDPDGILWIRNLMKSSTTMRMILGLDAPTSGCRPASAANCRPASWPSPLRSGRGAAGREGHRRRPQRGQPPGVAGRQQRHRPAARERGARLVGLGDVAGKRVGTFSLGMNQRLGIAAALLGDPETVMFDEPINGLDPEGILVDQESA